MFQLRSYDASSRWAPPAAAALLWALAAASATLWWLHLPRNDGNVPGTVGALPQAVEQSTAVRRALGHSLTRVAIDSDLQKRFQLLGVISSAAGQGSALIAVDGQAAKVYVPGQHIDDHWQVGALGARTVTLQGEGHTRELILPSSSKN